MSKWLLQTLLSCAMAAGTGAAPYFFDRGGWWFAVGILLVSPACWAITQSAARWIGNDPWRSAYENLLRDLQKLLNP